MDATRKRKLVDEFDLSLFRIKRQKLAYEKPFGAMESTSSSRLTFGSENEWDNDSMMALTELDKGLRSGNVGEQCEAIVRFPRLFEKFPFPILINSAALKLADVFRCGTNFMRMCVLRVCQQSNRHLDKIINVDEFVGRIFSVIHSNDPVARGLTLRLLSSIAVIIPEMKEVHNAIRSALDSHDREELEAAILAAVRFTKYSKTFSANICGKIGEMVEGISHPVEIKLKLLPIFGGMYHDAETALTVRKLCLGLLGTHPSVEFVIATIRTLTRLSLAALVNIPEQVSLLLDYLQNDPRYEVNVCALKDLRLLAKEAPEWWSEGNWKAILQFAFDRQNHPKIFCDILPLICILADSGKLPGLVRDSRTRTMCKEIAFENKLALMVVEVVTVLASFAMAILKERADEDDGEKQFVEDVLILLQEKVIVFLDNAILSPNKDDNNNLRLAYLKRFVVLLVRFSAISDELCARHVHLFASFIPSLRPLFGSAICAMGSKGCREALKTVPPIVTKSLKTAPKEELTVDAISQHVSLLFMSTATMKEWSDETRDLVEEKIRRLDNWSLFRLTRQAARYGHFEWASERVLKMAKMMTPEEMAFYLRALSQAFIAEDDVSFAFCEAQFGSKDRWDGLSSAIVTYHGAGTTLKAVTPPDAMVTWRGEFFRLRIKMLEAYKAFLTAMTGIATCPPPTSWKEREEEPENDGEQGEKKKKPEKKVVPKKPGDEVEEELSAFKEDLNRYGSAAQQLTSVLALFRRAAIGYKGLLAKSFDADPASLASLSLLADACHLIANGVKFAAFRTPFDAKTARYGSRTSGADEDKADSRETAAHSLEHKYLDARITAVAEALERLSLKLNATPDRPFSPSLVCSVARVTATIFEVPLCYPRFFFQRVQRTNVKLQAFHDTSGSGLLTSSSTSGASIPGSIVAPGAPSLAIKIEGVIERGGKCVDPHRRVEHIVVTVSSNTGGVTMKQKIAPKNDFFTAQFALDLTPSNNLAPAEVGSDGKPLPPRQLPTPTSVVVDTEIIDEKGRTWQGGVGSVLPIGAPPKPLKTKSSVPAVAPPPNTSRASSPMVEKDSAVAVAVQ